MSAEPLILSPAEMTKAAEDIAVGKVTSTPLKSFLLALTAGAYIGIGFAFFVTSQAGAESVPWGISRVIGGLVFTTGLALVVLTGAELFTSSTLTLTAKASGRITWAQLFRNWGIVYVGNFLGAVTLALLMWFGGTWELDKGAWGATLLKTADTKCSHNFVEAFFLGILCNMLVCLAVWCTYAGRTAADKILALTLPIAMFVATGFEHSVANMFLLPFGLIIKAFAPDSFWNQAGLQASSLSHLTPEGVFIGNLLPVSLGNIVGGGIMIGMLYWYIYNVAAKHKQPAEPASVEQH